MDKLQREVFIGNYQRDHGLSDALNDGIKEARHSLFDFLRLDQSNVLAINNDATWNITFKRLECNVGLKCQIKQLFMFFLGNRHYNKLLKSGLFL